MSVAKKKIQKIAREDDKGLENDAPETIVENLYKKNIELSVKNKTLSLLSKLYEIGILTLEPQDLSLKISQTVQVDLSFELVGIYNFDESTDALVPLAFSKSKKVDAALAQLGLLLEDIPISKISKQKFFKNLLLASNENNSNSFEDVYGDFIDTEKIQTLVSESNIKTTLLYPLVVESKTLGMILLSLNRNYESLSTFEKESLKSIMNVTALALEKAYLYKELENANAQLRELDRQKDELLSIVSHQFATPVSALKWNFEMMLDGDDGKLSEKQEENVKSLQNITNDLSDLVSMILDVSRVQLGRMKMDRQELDLDVFFKEILEVIEPKAEQKKVKFVVSLPKKFPKAFLDKRYTRMTIENLLSNAVKYTPANGDVHFDVNIKNKTLYCEVRDTGVGIPKDDQDKIFGKQFRASNVRNEVDGNGFGLYVAKGSVEAQGGKIWFKSEQGKGTTFFVELPLNFVETKDAD